MKLLIATERFQDPPTNGSETFAAALIRALAKDNDVTVVCRPVSPGAVAPADALPRVEVPDELLGDGNALTAFLRDRLDPASHDILYNLGNLYFSARLAAFLLILAPRLPMANHFQTVLAEYSRVEGLDETITKQAAAAQALCIQLGSLNIFASLSEYRAAIARGLPVDALPAAIIPNGIDIREMESATAPPEAQIELAPVDGAAAPFVVLTSGRFSDFAKGGDIAYRAFLRLHATHPNARLISITDSPRFWPLLDALPPGVCVRMPWLPRAQYLRVLNLADVVLVPSRYEAFGLAAVEAMALGKPVVASATGGLEEIVLHEKTGLVAEPGSGSFGLASALQRMAAAPEMTAEMGTAAAAYARPEYDIHRVATLVQRELRRGLSHANAAANVAAAGITLL